jgi:hypothetical protein
MSVLYKALLRQLRLRLVVVAMVHLAHLWIAQQRLCFFFFYLFLPQCYHVLLPALVASVLPIALLLVALLLVAQIMALAMVRIVLVAQHLFLMILQVPAAAHEQPLLLALMPLMLCYLID